ncbi:MAG: hypothetical protein AAGI38_16690 [Bacteroidota bacterium]
MPHILRNKDLEVHIELPNEGYIGTRFDWTGKVTQVLYKGNSICGQEILFSPKAQQLGKGLYNEFGIEAPIGFEECEIGDWCHKIGVGLIKKESELYDIHRYYEVQPCEFRVHINAEGVRLICQSASYNGYAYRLEKHISLSSNNLVVKYRLINQGEKAIQTTEYSHNFICINSAKMDQEYVLRFPFDIQPEKFEEYINPGKAVKIEAQHLTFHQTPEEAFFIRNMAGTQPVIAHWQLEHHSSKIGISETGNFPTSLVNLWGMGYVICPELFANIAVEPGQGKIWSRKYYIYELMESNSGYHPT